MTSKLKCPVCGKTELIRMFNPLTGEYFEDYDCPFRLCNFRGNKVAVDALIQAKQDLEIAVDALKYYADSRFGKKQDDGTYVLEIDKGCGVTVVYTYDPRPAKKALKQIDHKE